MILSGRHTPPGQIDRKDGRRALDPTRRNVAAVRPRRTQATPPFPGLLLRPTRNGVLELAFELRGASRPLSRILLQASEHDLFQVAGELASESRRRRLRRSVQVMRTYLDDRDSLENRRSVKRK